MVTVGAHVWEGIRVDTARAMVSYGLQCGWGLY